MKFKVLLDQGSQRSYVSEKVKNRLGLSVLGKEHLSINTFGNNKSKDSVLDKVSFELNNDKKQTFEILALCNKTICLPIMNNFLDASKERFSHLKGIKFADPGESGDDVDVLIGSDFYWSLVTGNVRKGKEGEPVAIETEFGWVLNGPVKDFTKANFLGAESQVNESGKAVSVNFQTHALFVEERESFEIDVDRFWDLETLGIREKEFSNYETFAKSSIYVNDSKRYETLLPFKENHEYLNDNYKVSEKRLKSLYVKLKKDPVLLKKYDDVFKEQMQTGIIEEAPELTKEGQFHYLPHHAVVRDDHETTKLRIVFDASAKAVDGPSLNDCLYKGPQLTPLIFDILLRFRTYFIALTADIEKAFLQISISPQHRDFVRFLWFEDVFADFY